MSDTSAYEAPMNADAPDPSAARPQQTGARPAAPSSGIWQPTLDQRFDPRRKSPPLAAVLSVIPGVGQVYIGYYVRGFVIAAIFGLMLIVAAESNEPLGPVLALGCIFLWIFNIIDAGRMAALYNHAAAGVDTVQMPEDFKLPKMGGSIVGGAALLTFGAIALSHTAFNYSLDWLEDWWPLFPLALGGYLLARGVMERQASSASDSSRAYRSEAGSDGA